MNDQPYSVREIDQLFKAADARADEFHNTLMARMDDFESNTTNSLGRIELQTTKTNGRVNSLERWQSYVIGFCAAVTLLLVPLLIAVASKHMSI